MVGGLGHVHGDDALRAVHVTGMAVLDARILAGFEQRGQEGVFAVKSDQHQQVGPVQQRHEARLHRHAVRVFDAGGQAADLDVVAADVAREIGQVGERGDDADFGGVSGQSGQREHAAHTISDKRQNSFDFIINFPFLRLALLASHASASR